MKQVYTNLQYQQQALISGLWQIQITPREWLNADPVIDFETGQVMEAVPLKEDKFWLLLQLTPQSYEYSETQKNAKSGDYFEIAAGGALNVCNAAVQQVLETVRRSELVGVLYDRNKRSKLIGDTTGGMRLAITHTYKNAPAGQELLQLDFSYQAEDPPPYFNPLGLPSQTGNFLMNNDGNFLLIG